MIRSTIRGAMAGMAGATALDMVTYADMTIRGRAPSGLPAKVVQKLAGTVGDNVLSRAPSESSKETNNRRDGLGALSGLSVGVGIGAAYGFVRAFLPIPWPVGAVLLAAAAMAASDVPASKLGATDPSTWSASDWASDIVPHLAYGACTAFAFETLSDR
jgi:hypothetical protein